MTTIDTVLDALKNYQIDERTVYEWETSLGLVIPVDEQGRKHYSPHHINLFRNIRKHLALGRTLDQIRQIICLPSDRASRPQQQQPMTMTPPAMPPQAETAPEAAPTFASTPAAAPAIKKPAESASLPAYSTPINIQVSMPDHSANIAPFSGPSNIPTTRHPRSIEAEQAANQAAIDEEFNVPGMMDIEPPSIADDPLPSQASVEHLSIAENRKYVSAPIRTPSILPGTSSGGSDPLASLVDRLMTEKDEVQKKLIEAEKLNSHLYNVNNLFHRKVKELSATVATLKDKSKEGDLIRLMDDKAKLHKQLLEAERAKVQAERERDEQQRQLSIAQEQLAELEETLRNLTERFDTNRFRGAWQERATLQEISYDNFGINIETERTRPLAIEQAPARTFGSAALITTAYEYESNSLWKRIETLMISYLNEERLEGELICEYLLDGVPVTKAIYRVQCSRIADDVALRLAADGQLTVLS